MPVLLRRLIGGVLIAFSVYFVAVVAFSWSQLVDGEIEFQPWLLAVIVFGGLAYLTGRYGWRMVRAGREEESAEEPPGS